MFSKQYNDPSALGQHKRCAHEGVRYASDKCDISLARRWYLRQHKLTVHEGVNYPYI